MVESNKVKGVTVSGAWLREVWLTLLAERGGLIDGDWQMERKVVLGVELTILEVEFSYKREFSLRKFNPLLVVLKT